MENRREQSPKRQPHLHDLLASRRTEVRPLFSSNYYEITLKGFRPISIFRVSALFGQNALGHIDPITHPALFLVCSAAPILADRDRLAFEIIDRLYFTDPATEMVTRDVRRASAALIGIIRELLTTEFKDTWLAKRFSREWEAA